ncbi:hypothetical protein CC78DRAFT_542531 [Lojkania enalia]|uniref:Chromo domain-containing protein n=1 Tax=Lojkania enalia TaxID=147567 RepID=A0A9P4KBM8_9PLEO|nr:hypothetical protein CC78DRAFT_542531 [Didymosphaeria enalia]
MAMKVGGRPRGSGKKRKTTKWEWEVYEPGPEVYNSLFRVHRAPPIITPNLPNECPIPNAHTKILARRQTEGTPNRHYYRVLVRWFPVGSSTGVNSESPDDKNVDEVIEEVDMSRILRYVSARELERFENAEFRAEAEADRVAKREAQRELEQKRLAKNARVRGAGRGSRMLADLDIQVGHRRGGGRPPRGRGRGRVRGGHLLAGDAVRTTTWAFEDATANVEEHGHIIDEGEPPESFERVIDGTEDEEEDEDVDETSLQQVSPDLTHSSFLVHSALPIFPAMKQPVRANFLGIEDLDENSSTSSAAQQLISERQYRAPPLIDEDEDEDVSESRHRDKRRRTESKPSSRRPPASHKSGKPIPSSKTSLSYGTPKLHVREAQSSDPESVSNSKEFLLTRALASKPIGVSSRVIPETQQPSNDEESDKEEYVVEAILAHSRDNSTKYYLVKWEGYGDAADWIAEKDLEGAKEMVNEYEARRRRKARMA